MAGSAISLERCKSKWLAWLKLVLFCFLQNIYFIITSGKFKYVFPINFIYSNISVQQLHINTNLKVTFLIYTVQQFIIFKFIIFTEQMVKVSMVSSSSSSSNERGPISHSITIVHLRLLKFTLSALFNNITSNLKQSKQIIKKPQNTPTLYISQNIQIKLWKTTGKDKQIFGSELLFYLGRAPKGEKTNWIKHEYPPSITISRPSNPPKVPTHKSKHPNQIMENYITTKWATWQLLGSSEGTIYIHGTFGYLLIQLKPYISYYHFPWIRKYILITCSTSWLFTICRVFQPEPWMFGARNQAQTRQQTWKMVKTITHFSAALALPRSGYRVSSSSSFSLLLYSGNTAVLVSTKHIHTLCLIILIRLIDLYMYMTLFCVCVRML